MMSPNFKSKELMILLSFNFHEVLGQLKAYIFTNFHFKRVVNFVIEWKIRAIQKHSLFWLFLKYEFLSCFGPSRRITPVM